MPSPLILIKGNDTWSTALKNWSFQDRKSTDPRWYLRLESLRDSHHNPLIVPAHPLIDNIEARFEGKTRSEKYHEQRILEAKLQSINSEMPISHSDDAEEPLDNLPSFITNDKIL